MVAAGIAFFGYCSHLNKEVREKFEGKRFELPARVYARPLELFTGKALAIEQLQLELQQLGYRKVKDAAQIGQYAISNGAHQGAIITLYARPFEFWDGTQKPQKLELTLGKHKVGSIFSLSNRQPLEIFRLEPLLIGGIYPSENKDRQLVRYNQVPRHFIDALIAIEDKRFYFHDGIDLRAIARAFVSTVSGRELQGGSTLTQQLVKNFYLSSERTLKRKLNEVLMALIVDYHYDKNEILETYINEVYLGQDGARAIHGIGLASQFYFGVPVEQLQPHQSALLVAMLKGPAHYNPRRNPKRALKRRDLVLKTTFEQGFLPQWSYDRALSQTLDVIPKQSRGTAKYPGFIDLVVRQLKRDYKEKDLRTEGLRVFTTLDPALQHKAEATVKKQLDQFETTHKLDHQLLQTAVIFSSRQTAEVLALIGDRQPEFEGFNRALDAKRQIGSLLKPAIYLTALERPKKYTLSTLLDDSPLQWQAPGAQLWQPNNYDNKFHGDVPMWLALAHSYNVPSVKLGLELGIQNVINTAKRLGITQPLAPYGSTLLGTSELSPLEITQFYQAIASGGFNTPLRAIKEVLDQHGKPLKRYGIQLEAIADARMLYMLNRSLQLVVTEGTGKGLAQYLSTNLAIAGKTGTTDDHKDSWFAGFSGNYLGVVWIGNDQGKSTGLTGAAGAMALWGAILKGMPVEPLQLTKPEGIIELSTHRDIGERTSARCHLAISLPFLLSSAPTKKVNCKGKNTVKTKVNNWWKNLIN